MSIIKDIYIINSKGEPLPEVGYYDKYLILKYASGNKHWYLNGQLHRVDGPAIEYANGNKYWYLNGKRHRVDGPAWEGANGSKGWYLNGQLHRVDGTAMEYSSGSKEWCLNGQLHRIDGPAREWADGDKQWFINGQEYNEDEYKIMIKALYKTPIVSAGIVPVRFEDGQPLFLMLRVWTLWDFPKGRKEVSDMSDIETALRETQEETSIPAGEISFTWGREYHETEPYRKKKDKVGRYFVGKTEFTDIYLPVSPELGKPEHEEFRWVSYEEGKKLTNERIGKVLDWAMEKIG